MGAEETLPQSGSQRNSFYPLVGCVLVKATCLMNLPFHTLGFCVRLVLFSFFFFSPFSVVSLVGLLLGFSYFLTQQGENNKTDMC